MVTFASIFGFVLLWSKISSFNQSPGNRTAGNSQTQQTMLTENCNKMQQADVYRIRRRTGSGEQDQQLPGIRQQANISPLWHSFCRRSLFLSKSCEPISWNKNTHHLGTHSHNMTQAQVTSMTPTFWCNNQFSKYITIRSCPNCALKINLYN